MLVLLVVTHLAFMFPSVVARPRMLCIMAGMDQKDSIFVVVMAVACAWLVFLGVAPRAVFPYVLGRPRCSWR